jgi:transmembrane protein EpsG
LIDFFTYFVYTGLLFSLIILANLRSNTNHDVHLYSTKNNFKIEYFFSVLLISIVIGFRYNVGNDWAGYVDDFTNIASNTSLSFEDQYYEFGFFYLNRIISQLGHSYHWMFFSMAFFSWYFIYKSLPNKLIPLFIFFIFTNEYFFWSMNGVRQFAAISIGAYSIKFLISREKYYYFFFVFIASLFHYSAFFLFLFYFLPIVYNKKLLLILHLVSLFLGTTDFFSILFFKTVTLAGTIIPVLQPYLRYLNLGMIDLINYDLNYGLGYLFIITVNTLLLLFSGQVIKKYPSSKIYFLFFALGAILFNLSSNIFIIGRFNTFFLFMKTIVLSYTIYYSWSFKKYRFISVISIVLFLIFFFMAIYNSSNMSSPYQFLIK